ncbi:MAG: cytochrome c-type biogenesis protein CcmH, partial [Deltaproteobacteria bacterium]|nr:cytochrome c-type biogenesis protein CcmH [Deltaproteobacteria bacterium]
ASAGRVACIGAVPALALVLAASAVRAEETPAPLDDGAFVQGEKSVEAHLLAPCCWNGTLDVHESELASALRREIRGRLRGGEGVEAIEESLVSRYGERMRAAPKSERVGLLLGAGVLGVILAAGLLFRRVIKPAPRSATRGVAPAEALADDEWDRRLDDELDRRRATS